MQIITKTLSDDYPAREFLAKFDWYCQPIFFVEFAFEIIYFHRWWPYCGGFNLLWFLFFVYPLTIVYTPLLPTATPILPLFHYLATFPQIWGKQKRPILPVVFVIAYLYRCTKN